MRVTKVIRDYVQDEVSKKYFAQRQELNKTHPSRVAREEFDKKLDALIQKANAEAEALLTECGFDKEYYGKLVTTTGRSLHHPLDDDFNRKDSESRKKEKQAITDILLRLELEKVDLEKLAQMIVEA